MTDTASDRHPCAVTTARFQAGGGPAKGAMLPVRIDLIPDQAAVQDVAISLYEPTGELHPHCADVTVLLDRYDAEALRDALTAWLEARR